MQRGDLSSWHGDEALRQAHAALDLGDAATARERALHAWRGAVQQHDRVLEARALLCLGNGDRIVSRFRRAHDACQRSAHLFRLLGDPEGEAAALATLSHVATCLGRNEEAVEAALLATRLGEASPSPTHQSMLLNYLGVAYLWSRDFDRSDAAFAAAAAQAELAGPDASPYQPLLNRLWAEALRIVSERYKTGQIAPLDRMADFEARCADLVEAGQARGLFEGSQVTAVALGLLGSAMLRCWSGDHEDATRLLAQAGNWVRKYRTTTWLEVFEQWVRMEIAWVQGESEDALAHCATLIESAERLEYEQLVCLGHVFASQLHEQRGEHAAAVAALRRVREREEMIRVESLQSRERAVQWQLDLRRREHDVVVLEGQSRHLERLSLEDSLTGIANRRCFERTLSALLLERAARSPGLCVAFIDVDRFKQVNDAHSHHVGDRVLVDIAKILVGQIRDGDIAARLAGDEFAVILTRATSAEAEQVGARIASAVARHPWSQRSPGLEVTISVGIAEAEAGDDVESLLHRGDVAMYDRRRAARTAERGAVPPSPRAF